MMNVMDDMALLYSQLDLARVLLHMAVRSYESWRGWDWLAWMSWTRWALYRINTWDNSKGFGNPLIWPVRLASGRVDGHLACGITSCPLGGGFHIHTFHFVILGHFFSSLRHNLKSVHSKMRLKKKPKYYSTTILFGMIVKSLEICFSEPGRPVCSPHYSTVVTSE